MLMFACSCTHTAALAKAVGSMHVGGWDVWFVVLLRWVGELEIGVGVSGAVLPIAL